MWYKCTVAYAYMWQMLSTRNTTFHNIVTIQYQGTKHILKTKTITNTGYVEEYELQESWNVTKINNAFSIFIWERKPVMFLSTFSYPGNMLSWYSCNISVQSMKNIVIM